MTALSVSHLFKSMILLLVLQWASISYLFQYFPCFQPLSSFMFPPSATASVTASPDAPSQPVVQIGQEKTDSAHHHEHNHQHDSILQTLHREHPYDAIVIGGGLGGIVTALTMAERGGSVLLVEKEPYLGGNSKKATSGINGLVPTNDADSPTLRGQRTSPSKHAPRFLNNDSVPLFLSDTITSHNSQVHHPIRSRSRMLMETLVTESSDVLAWLEAGHQDQNDAGGSRFLPLVSQLGGHSAPRTFRPKTGMIGSSLIATLTQKLEQYQDESRSMEPSSGSVRVLTNATVVDILGTQEGDESARDGVQGIRFHFGADASNLHTLRSRSTVLATGGFAANTQFVHEIRPDLKSVTSTTSGTWATGDGLHLGYRAGAMWTDMEYIQVHPTGFVDPEDPDSTRKVLAAEVLRGVGGILLNEKGERFCNELGTRKYISDIMMNRMDDARAQADAPSSTHPRRFGLVLSSRAADIVDKHLLWYKAKGLMKEVVGVRALAEWVGDGVDPQTIRTTLDQYKASAKGKGVDEFGKTVFQNVFALEDYETEVFHVGFVTPVLHYCMGGLAINEHGQVLNDRAMEDDYATADAADVSDVDAVPPGNHAHVTHTDDDRIVVPGLYAVGEVTGGLHGENRLGGNSLLECVVFGRIIGRRIMADIRLDAASHGVQMMEEPMASESAGTSNVDGATSAESVADSLGRHGGTVGHHSSKGVVLSDENGGPLPKTTPIPMDDVARHASDRDCWIVVHGGVFDLSVFADRHPGGAHMIRKLCGKDGTSLFDVVHEKSLLRQHHVQDYQLGVIDGLTKAEASS